MSTSPSRSTSPSTSRSTFDTDGFIWHEAGVRGWLIVLCATAVGCQRAPAARPDARPASAAPADSLLTLIATAEVRGTPEPCGCQSDPLGDIARVATLLSEARGRGGALLVDAGGLRDKITPPSPLQRPQASMQADF